MRSRSVLTAVWAFPVMVLGGFAFLAGIPVAVIITHAIRQRVLRWWTVALTTAYVVPVAVWLLGPSDAPSLTKFMSPALTAVVAAVGVLVALAQTNTARQVART
ncbi:hypothetical protein ACIA49_10615 [Kribbella sp. NPDC051587]|uniref:hypothetical protein n=1 Tax=Kribbella sp. NPDC051587 TaxID=3364119 RepID=UPI0037A706F3